MPEKRRRFDREFREGAVRIVRETRKPIDQVAADLGINSGTLGNWVKQDKIARGESEASAATSGPSWLVFGRRTPSCGCSVMSLKRSVVLWVKEATR